MGKNDDVPTEVVEYEKQKEELTFVPNIGSKSKLPNRPMGYMDPLTRQSKAYDDELPRYNGASPPKKKNEQFWINVKLGNQTKTIMATLQSDPARLAQNFLKANGFDMSQAETLERIIA